MILSILKAISQKIVNEYQNLYSIGYDAVEWVSSVYLPRINFGMDEVTIREVIVNQCNEVNEQNDLACWAYSLSRVWFWTALGSVLVWYRA